MSIRTRTLIITGILVFFTLICVLLMKAPDPKPRKLRRVPAMAMAKPSGYFNTAAAAVGSGDRWTLDFTVTAAQDTQEAEIVWHLPEGARILKGDTKNYVGTLRRGETRTYSIEVSSLDKAIHAEVFTIVDSIKLGAGAAFAEPKADTAIRAFGMKAPNIIQ
ncbi:MAG TPA: hypothetical protein VFV50_09110 [Bdellovibrionales bacterium]|nr:hypothetical protein [Bdellovibrionales bacterium]